MNNPNWTSFCLLLPFLEQDALYQQLANSLRTGRQESLTTSPSAYVCPSDSGIPSPPFVQDPSGAQCGLTSYRTSCSALSYLTSGFGYDGALILSPGFVSMLMITDGASNTILFGKAFNYDPN